MFGKKGKKAPTVKSEELADERFEQLRGVMQSYKGDVKATRDAVESYRQALRAVLAPMRSLSEHLVELHADDDTDEGTGSAVATGAAARVELAAAVADAHLQTQLAELTEFKEHLHKKNKELHELRDRVAARDAAVKSYDKSLRELADIEKKANKDRSKVLSAEAKVNSSKGEFDAAHAVVLDDLLALEKDRFTASTVRYGQFIDSQDGAFRAVANAWKSVLPSRYDDVVPVLLPPALKEKREKLSKKEAKKKKKEEKKAAKAAKKEMKKAAKRTSAVAQEEEEDDDEDDDDDEEEEEEEEESSGGAVVPAAAAASATWDASNPFKSSTNPFDAAPEPEAESSESESESDSDEIGAVLHGAIAHTTPEPTPSNDDDDDFFASMAGVSLAPALVPQSADDDESSTSSSTTSSSSSSSSGGDKAAAFEKAAQLMTAAFSALELGDFSTCEEKALGSLRELLKIYPSRAAVASGDLVAHVRDKPPSAEHVARVKTCVAYALAARVFRAVSDLEAQQLEGVDTFKGRPIGAVIALYSKFLTDIPLRPKHRLVCLRLAVQRNADARNYGISHRLMQLLRTAAPDEKGLDKKMKFCESKGLSNENAIAYKLMCFSALQPIVGPPKRCSVCQALYSAKYAAEACDFCGLSAFT